VLFINQMSSPLVPASRRTRAVAAPRRLALFLAAEATFTTGVDHILSGGAELAYGRKTRLG
jgi:hypothetical protein